LILWDSRTVHYGSEAIKGRPSPNIRTTLYVSYSPRSKCTQAILDKRIDYFENRVMTNHWAHDPIPKPTKPTYGVLPAEIRSIVPPNIPPVYKHLIGYNIFRDDYFGEEMENINSEL